LWAGGARGGGGGGGGPGFAAAAAVAFALISGPVPWVGESEMPVLDLSLPGGP
jgi:hypothetical protein